MRKWTELTVSYEQLAERLWMTLPSYGIGTVLSRRGETGWKYPLIAGLGVHLSCSPANTDSIDAIDDFISGNRDYVFGHLCYGLKQETENVQERYPAEDGFAQFFFFIPQIVVLCDGQSVRIGYLEKNHLDLFLEQIQSESSVRKKQGNVIFHATTSREKYLDNAQAILRHIHRGDIYEMNYCIGFQGENTTIDPTAVYGKLQKNTAAPYGGFYKNGTSWLLCGSPELFLKKTGDLLTSEPIKGTRRRGATPEEDQLNRDELFHDDKERAENVMIVDLVRNDLSKVTVPGTVEVPELYKITSHKTVHQMSSRVVGKVSENITFAKIIRATFPMGSMTGAPKISAMQIAGQFENQARGIYSGCIGFIEPGGDFEFNVVIRSITWNELNGKLEVKAGSALTAKCDPLKEFEECELKAKAMIDAVKSV